MKQPPQRVFADPEGKSKWREYKNVKEVPELSLEGGEAAMLWSGRDGKWLVRTEEPGEDFDLYTDYCFDENGELSQFRYEVRTAWNWGFRQQGKMLDGKVANARSEFFNTKNEERIPQPDGAHEIPGLLKPHLYLRKSELPFARLLKG